VLEQLRKLFSGAKRPTLVNRLNPSNSPATSIVLSPDDRSIAIGYKNGSIKLVQIEDSAVTAEFRKSERSVECIRFASDGLKLAAAQYEWEVRVWDLSTKACVQMQGRTGGSLAFSPDGNQLAVGQHRGGSNAPDIEVFDTTSGALIWTLHGHRGSATYAALCSNVTAVEFSPDGKELVSAGHDLQILAWPIPWNNSRCSPLNSEGISDAPQNLRFSPDGSSLLADTTVYAEGAKAAHSLRIWRSRQEKSKFVSVDCESFIWDSRFSRDGSKVIAVSNKSLWLWEGGGKAKKVGDSFVGEKHCFSESGARLAVTKSDSSIEIWDVGCLL